MYGSAQDGRSRLAAGDPAGQRVGKGSNGSGIGWYLYGTAGKLLADSSRSYYVYFGGKLIYSSQQGNAVVEGSTV
jgi:hypothetical protein